jgi:hypothetical protein
LNFCDVRLHPPATIDTPATKRRLPRIEPLSEARTTSGSPARMAKMAMIISAKLPKVALNSAPYVAPIRCASCSVLIPIHAASGSTAAHAKTNSHTRLACMNCRVIATGIVV